MVILCYFVLDSWIPSPYSYLALYLEHVWRSQWIGLRENLQEPKCFMEDSMGFQPKTSPKTNPLNIPFLEWFWEIAWLWVFAVEKTKVKKKYTVLADKLETVSTQDSTWNLQDLGFVKASRPGKSTMGKSTMAWDFFLGAYMSYFMPRISPSETLALWRGCDFGNRRVYDVQFVLHLFTLKSPQRGAPQSQVGLCSPFQTYHNLQIYQV